MIKLFSSLKPYWFKIILVLGLTMSGVYADLFLPKIMASIINNGVLAGDWSQVPLKGLQMLGCALLAILCSLISGFLASQVAMSYGRDLRKRVFDRVTDFSLAEYDRFGAASLLTRTTNDINQLQQMVVMGLRIMLRSPLLIVGGITMAYATSPELFRVVFFSVPMLVLVVVVLARRALPLSTSIQQRIDRVNRLMREKLTGIRVQRAFGTEAYEEQRFDGANRDLTQVSIKMSQTMSFLFPSINLLMAGVQIFLVYSGAVQISLGALQVGDVMAVIQYVVQIMVSLTIFSMIFMMLPRAIASGRRVLEVLNTPLTLQSPPQPREADDGPQRGTLEFQNVSFSYGGAQEPALRGLSFAARPGETIAIIGGTGSGKTTLLNLIPRFYDVTEGSVLVDGVDVREMDLKALRDRIGYVPQKAMLFGGSIAENIRYGNQVATPEEMAAAARVAQAQEFIDDREQGYDARVSQLGANLSGGQKQRLSIARAVVRQPDIYLFDDSFSALDAQTDRNLREALRGITQEAIVLIVAQKVSTIRDASRILVLDKGICVGMGTHQQLLDSCQVYQEVVASQHSTEEVDL